MKTSLLVLSLLMASTNAIDITTVSSGVPAAIPAEAKASAPTAAAKAPVIAAEPKVVDHKVDTPEHHVVAKGHDDLKKAAAVKAPSKKDDVVAAKSDDKIAAPKHEHTKCETPSCKAA